MFLINKMIDKKKKESSKLEDYSTLRLDGLNCSEKMLAEDIKNFITYFQKNSEESNAANKEAELMSKEKQTKM